MRRYLILLALPLLTAASLPGPIPAETIRVIDGDTVEMRMQVWLNTFVVDQVRLAGVDTPELHGACEAERTRAADARAFVERTLGAASAIALTDISREKYGRPLARIVVDGRDLSAMLIAAGLGRPYAGGTRTGWC